MNRLFFFTLNLAVIFFCYSNNLFAVTKKRVAILDFGAVNTSKTYASAVRNLFEVALHKTGSVDVLERTQMEEILKEQGFQLSGCVDSSCAVEIGKVLSADIIVMGNINKLDSFTITIRLVDVISGKIKIADYETAQNEKGIQKIIEKLTIRIAQKLKKPWENKIVKILQKKNLKKKKEIKEINSSHKNMLSGQNGLIYDISWAGFYIQPAGNFKNLASNGYGAGIFVNIKNYLPYNLVIGADVGYWMFDSSKDNVSKCEMIPVHLVLTYRYKLYKKFYLMPRTGAGFSYNSVYYNDTSQQNNEAHLSLYLN